MVIGTGSPCYTKLAACLNGSVHHNDRVLGHSSAKVVFAAQGARPGKTIPEMRQVS